VGYYLTGRSCTFLPSRAYESSYWTADAVEACGLDLEKLPPFLHTGETVGMVTRTASEATGIPAGIPVIAAGPDFLMSLLGTATISPGMTCDRAGTSEGVNTYSTRYLKDPRLLCLPHVVDGAFNVSGIISTTGKAVEWFRAVAGMDRMSYEQLYQELGRVPAGAGGVIFLPYLAGERSPHWDSTARASFLGLSLGHDRLQMGRAVLESIALAIRDVLEVMEEHGLDTGQIRVAGTQARSSVLNQIKADVTGRQLLVPAVQQSELMGDVCVALSALGDFQDPITAASECVRIERTYQPNLRLKELYHEQFLRYREAYRSLKSLFRRMGTPPSRD
jgi:xylulokinase